MKNIFDDIDINELKKRNTRFHLIFAVTTAISVVICLLAVIFWEKLGRITAQTIATLFTALTGFTGVYGFTVCAHNKKIISFTREMQNASLSELEGVVTATDKEITTMSGLQFYNFTVKNEKLERRFYIPINQNFPKIGSNVVLTSNGKYLASIEIKEEENE